MDKINKELAKSLKTELTAKMLILPPDDDYKKGFNEALHWAIELIKRYEKGKGLFQLD